MLTRPSAVKAALSSATTAQAAIRELNEGEERRHQDVRDAYQASHATAVRGRLRAIPVERLRDVTGARIPVRQLTEAGYTSIAELVEASPAELQAVPGIGAKGAQRTAEAARRIAAAATESTHVTADLDLRVEEAAALLSALYRVHAADRVLLRVREPAGRIGGALAGLAAAARPLSSRMRRALTGRMRREEAQDAVTRLEELLADPKVIGELERIEAANAKLRAAKTPRPGTVRNDFEKRSADYFSTLSRIAGARVNGEAARGFLPVTLADRVAAQKLDGTHLRVSLRAYQDFGARFALAQERVIIGDEMGCGKTVEAIAALAHLRATGTKHFLVVAPASVLINWMREVRAHSTLRPHRLHGPKQADNLRAWVSGGGVGITTFEALPGLDLPRRLTVGMLVVDEAHYVKNPDTLRSAAVRAWTDQVDRVLFLTGTPMENRVEEFCNLVGYLQPDLVGSVDQLDAVAGSEAFRKAVAPAYLRRNQEDVLSELPEMQQIDEWEEFGVEDAEAYREAVQARNFMAMRRAAYASGDPASSAKLRRLVEIADEAGANGRKVVVFSYFRDVLELVCRTLGDRAIGPLTGSMPPQHRQKLVDEFAAAKGQPVLVSQIQAGGVGLNMQAASVVILCEPQVKPTLETQAIARAHRMGQIRRVQVHRLLVSDSVDERMLEILETKSGLFDAYARRSETAETVPEAKDLSDVTVRRQLISAERERLGLAG
ncbi:DEAD/DEAH box helicase [Catenulispora pinisilvae]|uniref:DEAD/DEAH box helicase n=1 Tax=Catenulispora pinisilvae TaxID=2705253 RepID=UPI0018917CE2|nr:SNF2-related protein [Catenulispora pinisilvae]